MLVSIIIVVLVALVIFALFLVFTDISILKSIIIAVMAVLLGGGVYYCVKAIKSNEGCGITVPEPTPTENEKWGGIGLAKLCNVNRADDDTFLRIATDYDIDVQAFKKGDLVYANLDADQSGDAQMAKRNQFQSKKDKNAVINRSRFTADSVRKYYEDELQANENKTWWDNDELDAFV